MNDQELKKSNKFFQLNAFNIQEIVYGINGSYKKSSKIFDDFYTFYTNNNQQKTFQQLFSDSKGHWNCIFASLYTKRLLENDQSFQDFQFVFYKGRYCNEQNFCGDHVFLGIKLDPYPYDVRFLYDPTLLHKKSSNNRCFVFKHQLNDLSSRKFYYQNDLLQIEKDKNTFGHYQEVSENDVIKMLLVDLMNHTINPNDNDLLGKTTFQDSIKQFSLTL